MEKECDIVLQNVCDLLDSPQLRSHLHEDSGVGLPPKYINDPMRILEVHESSRENGHGLGMWIVHNTIRMTGGDVISIDGHNGFHFNFELGEKL